MNGNSDMSDEVPPPRDDAAGGSDPETAWEVDRAESLDRLRRGEEPPGGKLVYVDEHGRQRRLPAEPAELTREERRAAVAGLSRALGGPDLDEARLAAVERLTEMRAAGRISEEQFLRERRRLMGEG